ncbi:hypothetical protein HpBT321_10470 [Helicobacter pylori]
MRLKKMRLMKNSSFLNAFVLKLKDSAALVFSTAFVISLVLYLRKMGLKKMRLKKMRLMKNSSFLNAFVLKLKDSAA